MHCSCPGNTMNPSITCANAFATVARNTIEAYRDTRPCLDCIGAIARHSLDPQNSEFPPNDNNLVQVNHQVFVERGSSAGDETCGPFERRSILNMQFCREPFQTVAELRLGNPPLFNDWSLPPGWNVELK